MQLSEFLTLPKQQIAELVRQKGPKVCVFFSNGTRRWFLSQYRGPAAAYFSAYIEASVQRLREIFEMLLDYGIDTLVVPLLHEELKLRGEQYIHDVAQSIPQFFGHATLRAFYQEYQVRVRFFGGFEAFHGAEPGGENVFQAIFHQTVGHSAHRIFYGVLPEHPVNTITALTVKAFQETGQIPDFSALTQMYFGEDVASADLLLSSGVFYVPNLPLLIDHSTQLYFGVSPSFSMTEVQLRGILHDYLFSRRVEKTDYERLNEEDWQQMAHLFAQHQNDTLGVGTQNSRWGLWHPVSLATLPDVNHGLNS